MKKRVEVELKTLSVEQKGNGVETLMVVPEATQVETPVETSVNVEPVVKPELMGEAKEIHDKAKASMVIKDSTETGLKFTRRGKLKVEHVTLEAKPGFIPAGAPTKVKM